MPEPRLHAVIYLPVGEDLRRWQTRCLAHIERNRYELVSLVIDGEGGRRWEAVKALVFTGQADIVVLADRRHLPPDRLPRIEIAGEEATPDGCQRRGPRRPEVIDQDGWTSRPRHGGRSLRRRGPSAEGATMDEPVQVSDGVWRLPLAAGNSGPGGPLRDYGTLINAVTGEVIGPASAEHSAASAEAGETVTFLIDRDGDPCDASVDATIFGPLRTVYVDRG